MYSHELDTYIRTHNNTLSPSEYLFISDISKSPQIDHIKYKPYEDEFQMWTNDNWSWTFHVKQI